MGKLFEDEEYPLVSVILNALYLNDSFFKRKDMDDFIYNQCVFVLLENLYNKNDIQHFQYDLKYDKNDDEITIKPNNILTALWFINIYPPNGSDVLKKNKYKTRRGIYEFNKKTKKLKWIKAQ